MNFKTKHVPLSSYLRAYNSELLFYPKEMRVDHAEMVTRDESRILLQREKIIRVTGTTKKNLLEFADAIIDTIQLSDYSKYMPPGPNYN